MPKKSLTVSHKTDIVTPVNDTVSVYELVGAIRSTADGKSVVTGDGRRYFGKVTLCFHDGAVTHVERYETIK